MESSAPKRRKTSLTSSVSVDANGSGSSDGAVRRSTRRRRPSFASPTKASLARANPDILERRNVDKAKRQASAPAPPWPGRRGSNGSVSDMLTAQLEGASETGPVSDRVEAMNGDAQSNSAPVERPRSPIRRALGGMATRPKRTPSKPSPRPLPPPSAQEEELLDPFKGRVLRRSPPPGVLPAIEVEEPELPPTPTQKGISDPATIDTSPRGIHSTPTKRPRRSRILAEQMRSSPLKQAPMRPSELNFKDGAVQSQTLGKASRTTSNKTNDESRSRQLQKGRRKSYSAQGIRDIHPFADKKALRDSLLAELAQLEVDLEISRKENDRLHQLQQPRQHASVPQQLSDRDAILDVLRRHVLPLEKEAPPDPLENWLVAALNLTSFLPFGNSASAFSTLMLPSDINTDEEQPAPISHHPIPMTAAEELPYLQLFTPLTFSSSISLLPQNESEEDSAPPMQKHAITASSTSRGSFAARIEMTVNTKTLSVTELSVPRLDPAAVPELGPFIEKIAQGGSYSALKRNVSVMTWAMAEWTRLATKRAKFLCQIERELGSREGILECAKKVRNGKRRKGATGTPPIEDDDKPDNREGADGKNKVRKADLLLHLGRTSLDIGLGEPDDGAQTTSLRLSWRIDFDWTGEGQSKIGVLVEAPGKWHANDNRRGLVGIPKIFDELIQGGTEPRDAVRTIVALLVGDGSR